MIHCYDGVCICTVEPYWFEKNTATITLTYACYVYLLRASVLQKLEHSIMEIACSFFFDRLIIAFFISLLISTHVVAICETGDYVHVYDSYPYINAAAHFL